HADEIGGPVEDGEHLGRVGAARQHDMDNVALHARPLDGRKPPETVQVNRGVQLELDLLRSGDLGQHVRYATLPNHPPVVQKDDVVAEPLGQVDIVGGEDDRGAGQAQQLQTFDQVELAAIVERQCRL